jgi:Gas vesicle synthesis protein GvpL/GvpF
VIYAYGLGEAGATVAPADVRGLGGARLHTLEVGGLAAVHSRHRTLRPRPTRAAMWAHERVVEAMMERGPMLPLRFGTMLDGPDRLRAELEARGPELLDALQRVVGCVELGVRVLAEPAAERAPVADGERASGRAYVEARLREHRRAERLRGEVHAPLAELARASRRKGLAAAPTLLSAAYLVERARETEFRARAAALGRALEGARLVCTGPWPPYSFVGREGEA